MISARLSSRAYQFRMKGDYSDIFGIYFDMFKNELKRKLDIKSEVMPFTLTMLSRSKVMVSGVKNVLSSTETELKLRLLAGSLTVAGSGLQIVEIGGGDVYVKGTVGGLQFE